MEKARGSEIHDLQKVLHRDNLEKKARDKPTSMKKRPGLMTRSAQVRTSEQQNANAWVLSLYDPFSLCARFPEEAGTGTDTSTLMCSGCAYAPEVGVQGFGAAVYYPNLVNFNWVATGGTVGAVTYTAYSHPRYSSLVNYVAGYRTTSFGVRLRNSAKLLDRNGTLWVGRWPAQSSGITPPATLQSLLEFGTDVRSFDLASLPDDLYVSWFPLTCQSTVQATTHGGTTAWLQSALGFRGTDSNSCDHGIAIFWTSATGTTDLRADIVMNIEFFPHTEDQYLFSSESAFASPGMVSSAIYAATNLLTGGYADTVRTGVMEGVNIVRQIRDILSGPITQKTQPSDFSSPYHDFLLRRSRQRNPDSKQPALSVEPGLDPSSSPPSSTSSRARRGSIPINDDWENLSDQQRLRVLSERQTMALRTP